MFDYAISFYNEYIFLFYFFVIIGVILEWPIVVLSLILVSFKLWIPFWIIFILAFIWDFWWDLLHFFIWKFFKKFFFKKNKFEIFEKTNKKIEKISLFEKLIIIKYTPPISIIWLIYLWAKETKTSDFIKNDLPLCIFTASLILLIWYNFWEYFKNIDNFWVFLFLVWISIFFIILISKEIWKIVIKKIYERNSIK